MWDLAAFNTVPIIIARGADLAGTARETLDVVRRVSGIDVGIIYRLDRVSASLVLVAQRGADEEQLPPGQVCPLEGMHVSEAAYSGRPQITRLDASPFLDQRMRDLATQRGHRLQLALPIPVGGQIWGVMALISQEAREWSPGELAALDAVVHQIGLGVERTQLRETAGTRLNRLEAQRQIERHISEQLDLEQLLVIVAGSALRLIGGAFSVVYLREGDVLRPRAWSEIGDWIREARIPIGAGVTGHAVATGEGLIVNDYPNSPLALAPWSGVTMGLLAQPLLAGGRALGVMVISRDDTAEPFTPDDLTALADFATQAVVAIENARLFAETKRTAAEYQALFEVARLVGSTLDVDRLLDLIVDRCRALVGVASAGIFSLEADTGMLAYERGVGLSATFVDALRVRVGEGTSGRAIRDRTPVWTADILADPDVTLSPETRALVTDEGYRAVLSVPILSKGEPQGVLSAYWWEPHVPSASEVALMSAFAGQAGIALENARLYGAVTARGTRLATLARLTGTLTATLSLEDVLSRVVQSAVELFGSSVARLWLVDEGGQSVSLRSHAGTRTPLSGPTRLGVGEGLMGEIVAGRSPLVIQDLRTDPRVRNVEDVRAESTIAFAGVPLVLGDRVLGALSIALREARRFAEEELSLLHSLANHAAIAIENARLYGEAARQTDRIRAVAELGRTLVSSLDVNDILETVATRARDTLQVSDVGICLEPPEGGELRFVWGPDVPQSVIENHLMPGEGVAGRAVLESRPVWSSSILDDPLIDLRPETRRRIEAVGTRAVLAIPLVRERPFGALVIHREAGHHFTEPEIDYLSVFASQVAVALDNARLYAALDDRAARLRTLARLTAMVSSSLDANAVLQAIVRAATEIMRVPFVAVYGADEAAGTLELRATSDEGIGRDLPSKRRRIGEGLVGWVAEHRQPLVVADALSDARARAQAWARVHGFRSFVGVPILFQGSLLGVLTLNDRVPFRLSPDDESLLESFVSQAAVAIRNTRLYADNQRRVEELSVLHELSRAVTGRLDQADVLDKIEQQVTRLLDVRSMVILLYDDARDDMEVVLRVKNGVRMPGEPRRYPRQAAGLSSVVFDLWRPIRTDDYRRECAARGVEPLGAIDGLPYWLGLPMAAGDRMLGVLSLRSADRPFTEGDERLLANIADLAALALRSARLYEERTRAHGELAAAQDQLVRTEKLRALGEMASGVAHDFNNVLAAILGRAQLLREQVADPKLSRWIQVIERSALDGARTVRRLQDFTRVRRDHPAVLVDLNQVVQQTLEATESAWRQDSRRRGIRIEVVTAPTVPLPEISGDPAELREALTNLILNALDAMPEGGKLTLATAADAEQVEIAVTDTGIGIPADIRHRLFDPFFTTKGPKGTGLGLAMTYGILARHGARITVESEEGQGATFRLVFRVATEADAPVEPEPALASTPPLRCLVVDDEEAVAEVLGDMLVSAGHSVAVVGSGRDAIARFSAEAFDVVLTDLAMPGMTGWEVARAVKSVAPAARVILVSGYGVEVSTEDLRAHGVDLVLAKPFRLQDIEGAIAVARSARDE